MEEPLPPRNEKEGGSLMRILQLMNRVPWPLHDGGALGFYNYTKGYHDAGCSVTVCALNTSKHRIDPDRLPPELTRVARWNVVDIDTDITPWRATRNMFSGRSYHMERFESDDFIEMLINTLREKDYDVVIAEGIFMAPYVEVVRTYSKAICILREHNVEHAVWESLANRTKKPLRHLYLKMLANRLKKEEIFWLNHFDGITSVTEEDAAVFRKMAHNKPIFVSPFGYHLPSLNEVKGEPEPGSVFHLGSMEWRPNQQAVRWFMDKVWPTVSAKFHDANFYLAGKGMPPGFASFQGPQVKVLGEVPDATSFMLDKSIMVVPLFAGSGIRVKIIEGMALGKAIISTPLGAQGIQAESGKHLMIAHNEKEFAEALEFLLSHPEVVMKMGAEAKILANGYYNNTKVIQRVLSFYKTLIKQFDDTI